MCEKGFTLVEILITLAVISVLASVSFVSIDFLYRKMKLSEAEILKENFQTAFNFSLENNKPVLVEINFLNKSFSFFLNEKHEITVKGLKELSVFESEDSDMLFYITPYDYVPPLKAVFQNGSVFEITPLGETVIR